MVPTMSPLIDPSFSYEIWHGSIPDQVELTCMMPNGVVILLRALPNATIKEIKEELWKEADKYPLRRFLKEQTMYQLNAISQHGNWDDDVNESTRLCDVQPYFCILHVNEKRQLTEISPDYKIYKDIRNLIGKSSEDFQALKTEEVKDFRSKMARLGERFSHQRTKMTLMDKLLYHHPPRLAKSPQMPETIRGRNGRQDAFVIAVKLENETSFSFCVPYHNTPDQLKEMILTKMNRTNITAGDWVRIKDYILKVCGRDEFLYGSYPLSQFTYIQDTISRDGVPSVVMKLVQNLDIPKSLAKEDYKYPPQPAPKRINHISSWDIPDKVRIHLHSIERLNCDYSRSVDIGVHLGLYHGDQSLCTPLKTREVTVTNATKIVEFNEDLTFDIKIENLPRMVRLCIVVYEITKSTKMGGSRARKVKDSKELYMNPLVWVNSIIFDYKHRLNTGFVRLYTWTYADDIQSDELLHFLGTVESNPRTDECAAIKLTFHSYDKDIPIMYPSEESVLTYARTYVSKKNLNRDSAQDTRTVKEILTPFLSNDRMLEVHDQERNAIWAKREDCKNDEPEGLPFLLHCMDWKNRDEVAEMCSLLKTWPKLSVERSLELLDYAFADPAVRGFAVNCLRELRDEELLLYLLQLVQAIKHECYLDCDLVEFLLTRALRNQRIGHYFFWHLRSEMQVPAIQNRFGLILEAYLKGSPEHVPILLKQVECLDKLKQGSEIAKKGSGNKEKIRTSVQDFLLQQKNNKVFENVLSPLNPSYRCKTARSEKCKVMDSKMRPLWIVFENADKNGDDIYIIFKNGDDLRQDMLTLQMLRVMDEIWKSDGYDFRMNIYGCISMERRLGMIEVVLNAETIANIQKERGMFSATSPFKKGSLFSWLKEHNSTEEALEKAINEFTLSCAGYCVATYVLGVADRHSDNIMVKKNGQLFHIDFGHILGHFKEKFGVRRERVPFVLTHDFVYVINKGRNDREAAEFRKFQNLCEKAFLILRKHGCLILSLFAMMVSTGLPELSSEKDLTYLKETMVLDLPEDKAREHFRSKFSEALANSWKTSLNWASHNFSKNNKQ